MKLLMQLLVLDINKLIPLLKSFKESTDLPSIKGVYTLATFAKIMQMIETRTLNLKSFLFSKGQRKGV